MSRITGLRSALTHPFLDSKRRAIALRSERRVVGVIGFHGPPGGEWLRELAPGGVEFTVDAEDFDSGVQRVLVTIHAPNGKGGGVWYSLELQLDDITGMWRRFVPGLDAASLQYLVQAMDWAGNVTVTNNKGAFYGAIREVFLPLVMRN